VSTFSIKVDFAPLDAAIDAAEADVQAAARPSAQAAAQVIYDEVRRNVAKIKRRTGNLASSIYQAYSQDNSRDGRQIYHISWNARKAPHGHLVEFGHLQRYEVSYDPRTKRFTTHKDRPLPTPVQVAARPFLRPAQAKFPAAADAARERFFLELERKGVVR
jgi:hypothetical protein